MTEKEYARLQKESQLQALPVTQIKENKLTVPLLNTRSLRKHLHDILSHKYLLCNGNKGLTETQLEIRENVADLSLKLGQNFRVHFNCNVQKHRNIDIVTQTE